MFDDLTGAALATALAGVDVASLDADGALAYVLAAERVSSWAAATQAAGLHRMQERYPVVDLTGANGVHRLDGERLVEAEVRAAYGCSDAAAGTKLGFADYLHRTPTVAEALTCGRIRVEHAQMLERETVSLARAPAARQAIAETLLDANDSQRATSGSGLTMRQWRLRVRREVLAVDPTRAEREATTTRDSRRVWHTAETASAEGVFAMVGPVEATSACHAAVDGLAREWRTQGRDGTLAQLRFDAMHFLLTTRPTTAANQPTETTGSTGRTGSNQATGSAETGGSSGTSGHDGTSDAAQPGSDGADSTTDVVRAKGPDDVPAPNDRARAGVILGQITVPLSTLLGVDDAPGELAGVGPIPASVARELMAAASVWRRILTDPVDGHVVTQEIKGYRPTAAMRRFVLTRAGGVCSARGCGHRHGLQLDHAIPHPVGPTSADNLTPPCGRDHNIKTHGGWTHTIDPITGALTQTSPLGRRYTTPPTPPVGPTGRRRAPYASGCWAGDAGAGETCGEAVCAEGVCGPAVDDPQQDGRRLDDDVLDPLTGGELHPPVLEASPTPADAEEAPPDPAAHEDRWSAVEARIAARAEAERARHSQRARSALLARIHRRQAILDDERVKADLLVDLYISQERETDHEFLAALRAEQNAEEDPADLWAWISAPSVLDQDVMDDLEPELAA